MSVLVIEVFGKRLIFRGGNLDGRQFSFGEIIFVSSQSASFHSNDHLGVWSLQSSFHRGHPAVSCKFYDKRRGSVAERYYKVFYSDGLYICGPRFPRNVSSRMMQPRFLASLCSLAA
ncbi:MAG: hypothetical protein GYA55_06475 [SAR324 cluster bacterium]|uniref:Uncharacterized protein n=1 Tax=SAR324 cluster bacterium TaxID=2024889 RepID=A0A7X9FR46_9DELT|nr:hypothetical protein [SAR324 cluster bacterium]